MREAELRTILEERLQPMLAMGVSHIAQLHRKGELPASLVSALGQWLLDNDPMKVCAGAAEGPHACSCTCLALRVSKKERERGDRCLRPPSSWLQGSEAG